MSLINVLYKLTCIWIIKTCMYACMYSCYLNKCAFYDTNIILFVYVNVIDVCMNIKLVVVVTSCCTNRLLLHSILFILTLTGCCTNWFQ